MFDLRLREILIFLKLLSLVKCPLKNRYILNIFRSTYEFSLRNSFVFLLLKLWIIIINIMKYEHPILRGCKRTYNRVGWQGTWVLILALKVKLSLNVELGDILFHFRIIFFVLLKLYFIIDFISYFQILLFVLFIYFFNFINLIISTQQRPRISNGRLKDKLSFLVYL